MALPVAVPAAAPVAPLVAAPAALPPVQQVPMQPLEDRIRRLEEALARLQEARARDARNEAPAGAIQAGLPAERPTSGGFLAEMGRRIFRPSGPVPVAPGTSPPEKRRSLLWETVAEGRAIVRMFFDPRYRLSWTGRVVPLFLLAMIATSHWWGCVLGTELPLGIGSLMDKVVDLVLAFVLFKVLGHEARRYRETSPDLPPNLRL